MVKGDVLHSDGLRVLLFSTDESLNILARARTVVCDGTFRITPYLWYQTFRKNSFVPVCFGLLPDKTRRSYDDLFTLLKNALEHPSRNLELSAEWMMSDFEHNIRLSWVSIFPDVEAKGCQGYLLNVIHGKETKKCHLEIKRNKKKY